ncbi:hypothetical protein HMI56_002958 [Coelomomyces lativittatus]|nr:hypothetical protein HMI56_002958 [Coelomomyces lativittatus]
MTSELTNAKNVVLVTGASGLLGRAVIDLLKSKEMNVIGTAFSRTSDTLLKLDLTCPIATEKFIRSTSPSCIVHCAAERRPDQVAKSPQSAQK